MGNHFSYTTKLHHYRRITDLESKISKLQRHLNLAEESNIGRPCLIMVKNVKKEGKIVATEGKGWVLVKCDDKSEHRYRLTCIEFTDGKPATTTPAKEPKKKTPDKRDREE